MSEEVWRDIKDYNGWYQISNKGRVRGFRADGAKNKRLDNPKIMKSHLNNKGYRHIRLTMNGVRTSHTIHRLIARHFIPNPQYKPQINHIDGNPLNNNISNLEWCTHAENMKHAFNSGLNTPHKGESNGMSKLSKKEVLEIKKYIEDNKPQYGREALAEKYGVNVEQISLIANNKAWTHL